MWDCSDTLCLKYQHQVPIFNYSKFNTKKKKKRRRICAELNTTRHSYFVKSFMPGMKVCCTDTILLNLMVIRAGSVTPLDWWWICISLCKPSITPTHFTHFQHPVEVEMLWDIQRLSNNVGIGMQWPVCTLGKTLLECTWASCCWVFFSAALKAFSCAAIVLSCLTACFFFCSNQRRAFACAERSMSTSTCG